MAGVIEKELPVQIEEVWFWIFGIGWTVTVTVKGRPWQVETKSTGVTV